MSGILTPGERPDAWGTMGDMLKRIRALEAAEVPDAGITEVTSADGSVTVVDPTGPTVDLSVPAGGRRLLNYTQITSSVNITSANEALPNTIVTASAAVVLDGATTIAVTFYTPLFVTGTGASSLLANLWNASADLGRIAASSISNAGYTVQATRYFTPAAGSHTYRIRGWRANQDGIVVAGAGGVGTYSPAYILIESIA